MTRFIFTSKGVSLFFFLCSFKFTLFLISVRHRVLFVRIVFRFIMLIDRSIEYYELIVLVQLLLRTSTWIYPVAITACRMMSRDTHDMTSLYDIGIAALSPMQSIKWNIIRTWEISGIKWGTMEGSLFKPQIHWRIDHDLNLGFLKLDLPAYKNPIHSPLSKTTL